MQSHAAERAWCAARVAVIAAHHQSAFQPHGERSGSCAVLRWEFKYSGAEGITTCTERVIEHIE